jgi:hypothetical protein
LIGRLSLCVLAVLGWFSRATGLGLALARDGQHVVNPTPGKLFATRRVEHIMAKAKKAV